MIDITGVDLVKFSQKVYELSVPQGLGFFHYTPSPLSDEEAKKIIESSKKLGNGIVLDMDYVRGRACKIVVWEKKGKMQIRNPWYDHTDDQLKELLRSFNLTFKSSEEHGFACNCSVCSSKNSNYKV